MPPEIVDWSRLSEPERERLLARPSAARARDLAARVRRIVASVRAGGDDAIRRWTARLDGARLDRFEVTTAERQAAERSLGAADRRALARASDAVRTFHETQRRPNLAVRTGPGVVCELVARPIDSVGLYVPAGGAPLPSTALMLAVPATVAGCRERIVVTPPVDGRGADPAVVFAATLGGATRIFAVGGAQAIAALAFGTESVPRVAKIFGPGSAWVDEAKRQVASAPGGPAIDLPAGPSELLVVADSAAQPAWIAADLLAQAEHSADAQVLLATPDRRLAQAVARELARRAADLPRREIVARSLAACRLFVTSSLEEALELAGRYAPEHLMLAVEDPERWRAQVGAAGAVYLGGRSAPALGDYATGANHTLPTGRAARACGGLTLAAFERVTTFQRITPRGLRALAPTATRVARLERLEGHARSVEIRLAPRAGGKGAA